MAEPTSAEAPNNSAAYQAALTKIARGVATALRGRELNGHEQSEVEEAVQGALALGEQVYGSPERAVQVAASLGYAIAGDALGGGAGLAAYGHSAGLAGNKEAYPSPEQMQEAGKSYEGLRRRLRNELSNRLSAYR